jgi:hypothetical protein
MESQAWPELARAMGAAPLTSQAALLSHRSLLSSFQASRPLPLPQRVKLATTALGGAAPAVCRVHDPRREVLVRGELARREEKRAAEQAHDGRRHERRSSPARHAHPHRPLRSVVERLVSVELPALALRCTRTADERTVANRRERARAAAGGSKTRC